METFKQQVQDSKRSHDHLQDKIDHLQQDLQRSETRANDLELKFERSKSHLENGSQDNYLREELGRLRRESNSAKEKVKELRKTVTFLETEKSDLERRLQKSPRGHDQVDLPLRSQIPLMSAAATGQYNTESVVKVKILEQENERFIRKIRGLENQLAELEKAHGQRIQELLRYAI